MANQNIEVVMVPFPIQSHLDQLLQLSHLISSHNIHIHYVASQLHISQVKSRSTHPNPNPNIRFHSFPTPDFLSPPPTSHGFPSHLVPCFEASVELRSPVKSLLTTLSEKSTRLVVIHDPLMSSVVQDAAYLPNAESYVFYCVSAISHFIMIRDSLGLIMKGEIPSPGSAVEPEVRDFMERQFEVLNANRKAGILYNTCRALDGEFLELISERERAVDEDIKLWAFGPLSKPTNSCSNSYCLEWLDKQEPNSVLYVCFGTTTFMKDDQIRELAIGLERSGSKFIWVLRDADKANVLDESDVRKHQLPHGFEERVEGSGMGIVVREWVPQLEILGHSSTGGFMSHCGWNSCMESLSLGVPLATWPMHSDQPTNAFLVTQILEAGLAVREWAEKDELVSSLAISVAVKRMMNSDHGNKIRRRAEELRSELRKCTNKGGGCQLELCSFVAHITRN